jgi:hypothetical protein
VKPITILGRNCLPAGAFLSICSVLRDAGVDVSHISPSTPLAEYARKYPSEFLVYVSRLAPGALPLVEVRNHPAYDLCIAGMGFGALAGGLCFLLLSWIHSLLLPGILAWAIFVACRIGHGFAVKNPLKKVAFGNLDTFRDLAVVISKAQP